MSSPPTIDDACQACRNGDLEQLIRWQEEEQLPDLMETNYEGMYPHEEASRFGHLAILQWMMDDMNQEADFSPNGNRTFLLASENNHLEVMQWLFENPIQREELWSDIQIAFENAMRNGSLPAVQWILEETEYGEDIIASRAHCNLFWVSENGHLELLKWLLEAYGDEIISEDLNLASAWASGSGQLEVVKWLLSTCDRHDEINASGISQSLNWASKNGQLETVNWLLFDSGQFTRIMEAGGVEWRNDLQQSIEEKLRHATVIADFLQPQNVSDLELCRYLQSDVCYNAIQSKLVSTVKDLDRLLKDAPSHSASSQRRGSPLC